jgi:hypothetical protein
MSFVRFTDRVDKKDFIQKSDDFRLRQHGLPNAQILYVLSALLFGTCFLILQFVLYLMSPDAEFNIDFGTLAIYLSGIGLLLLVYSIFSYTVSNRIRNLLLETEYLNLIFASGMRLGTDFCLVLHNSGKAIYYDRNFSENYGIEKGQDALAILADKSGLGDDVRLKIQRSIEDREQISLDIPKYSIQITPLDRPKGFSVLKANKK